MARAYFDQNPFGAAPIEPGLDVIRRTYSQRAPTPMESLSKAVEQPFVTDVIVPGISRIRDEMRIAEQEEQIAAQAEAKRAAAAQFLQQAAAAEQQGLDAEVAAAVGALPQIRTPEVYELSGAAPAPIAQYVEQDPFVQKPTVRMAEYLEMAIVAGDDAAKEEMVAGLREAGMYDVAFSILGGSTARDAIRDAIERMRGSERRRPERRRAEQEATAAAAQRFERALAGELPQVAAEQAQAAMDIRRGVPAFATGAPTDDPNRLATRAYRKHLEANPGDTQGAMAAAQQAYGASAPQPAAQEAQAIQQPQLIEQANRLRQQATALEAEAKGIEATPVYREFGDYAMAFLEALETGDVAKQNALMASVGGSTDYQPAGKGAVGEAMSKDASMRARRDLLELKKDWLKAQRREKTGLKFINARKKKTTAKTGRAIARSGMGADEFDKLFKTNEFDKKIGTRQDRTIEYNGQTIDITYSSDPSGALQQLQSLSRYVRGKKTRRELQGRFSKIGTRISGTEEGTAATTKKTEETEERRESKKTAADKKAAKTRSVAIDKEVFGLRGDLVDIAADLLDARTERDKFDKEDLDDMTNQPAQAAAAAVRFLTAEQGRLMARVKALKAEKNALSAEEGSLSAGRKTSGGNAVTVVETP